MSEKKLAVLIDADNAQPGVANELLAEVACYGTATIKRAYGDWTTPHLSGWKEALLDHAIQPIQQFRFTTGKNATDSALIIDAMDLLHGKSVDGFCLVSSDSDFTRLATRIREAGLVVYGFGEKKTPRSFVAACDKFIFTEILRSAKTGVPSVEVPHDSLRPLLEAAVNGATREDGWVSLGVVGSLVAKGNPSFDPRNYGCQKLSELVRRQPYLEVKSVADSDGSPSLQWYVRLKET
jgi:hypothetical protein